MFTITRQANLLCITATIKYNNNNNKGRLPEEINLLPVTGIEQVSSDVQPLE
jgi:hypothetical protein